MSFLAPYKDIPELASLPDREKRVVFNKAYKNALSEFGWRGFLCYIPTGFLPGVSRYICSRFHVEIPFPYADIITGAIGAFVSVVILNHFILPIARKKLQEP